MCKKKRCVSDSSTESEIISLDAGLRMDGIPALDLWDLTVDVMNALTNQKQKDKQARRDPPRSKTLRNNWILRPTFQFLKDILNCPTSILFPQTRILLIEEPCCTSLKTTKLWSRWLSEAEVQHWDMFPEPTELLLTGYSTELTCTPRSTSNMSTPKTNSQTFLTKGNFTRDEWNHLLWLFNISLFSSQCCSHAMSKRLQEGDCEERIAAKSRPVRNLVSRSHAGISTAAIFDGIF